eukprot:12957532-Alexandrium_andersonii.AAC.1
MALRGARFWNSFTQRFASHHMAKLQRDRARRLHAIVSWGEGTQGPGSSDSDSSSSDSSSGSVASPERSSSASGSSESVKPEPPSPRGGELPDSVRVPDSPSSQSDTQTGQGRPPW